MTAGLEAGEGQPELALSAFRDCARVLRDTDSRLDLALLLRLMVRLLGRDHPDAQAAGREALEIYEQMGAEALARQVRTDLGVSGAASAAPQLTAS